MRFPILVLSVFFVSSAYAQSALQFESADQTYTFKSLEDAKVIAVGPTGSETKIQLSDLTPAELTKMMEFTGWGHQWESASGKFTVIAELQEISKTTVVLQKTDGKLITIPLEKLSPASREYAADRRTSDALPDRFWGKVASISGNTIKIRLHKRRFNVHLEGIHIPTEQPFARKAEKHLAKMLRGQSVTGLTLNADLKSDVNICNLYLAGKRVDLDLLSHGLAWHLPESTDEQRESSEAEAKSLALNIWSDGGPVAPWIQAVIDSPTELYGQPIIEIWEGKAVGISDGDTITVLNDKNEQVKIRLAGIDTPESKQAFGNVSRQAIGELVHEQTVKVLKTGEDRYKRTLGFIRVGNLDVNEEMVRHGFAWHYVDYSSSLELAELERVAREDKRGLWSGSEKPVAPWLWRKQQREANQ